MPELRERVFSRVLMVYRAHDAQLLAREAEFVHVPFRDEAENPWERESRWSVELAVGRPHECLRNRIRRSVGHLFHSDDEYRFCPSALEKRACRMDRKRTRAARRLHAQGGRMMWQKRRSERRHMRLIIRGLGKHICDDDEIDILRVETRRFERGPDRLAHEVADAFIPPLAKPCESRPDQKDVLLHTTITRRVPRCVRGIGCNPSTWVRVGRGEAASRLWVASSRVRG